MRSSSSALVTTSPALAVSTESSSTSFNGRLTGRPSNQRTCFSGSSLNSPNSLIVPFVLLTSAPVLNPRNIGEKVQDIKAGLELKPNIKRNSHQIAGRDQL